MKIYERQVTKQAISKRVIDEQQIDRHYNQNDLAELYKYDLRPESRPIPLVPKDVLLGEMLQKHEDKIYKYHEHQSLLENKEDEELNEEERKAAWEEFEKEKVVQNYNAYNKTGLQMTTQLVAAALTNILRKENPALTAQEIKARIPLLIKELESQLEDGETTMYQKIQQEVTLIHKAELERQRERFMQQNVLRALQIQQQQQAMFNAGAAGVSNHPYPRYNPQMGIQPDQLQQFNQWRANMGGPSNTSTPVVPRPKPAQRPAPKPAFRSNEVIDLND